MKSDSYAGRWLGRLVDLSFRRPWMVLGVFAALFAVTTWISSKLELRGDFIELLPRDTEEVRDLRMVEQKAGGDAYLVVQVTGGSKEERRAMAGALAPKLAAERDFVRYVEHRFDVDFFRKRALLLMPTDKLRSLRDDLERRIEYEKALANPFDLGLDDKPADTQPPPLDFQAIEKKYAADAPLSEYLESKDGSELYLYVKPAQQAGDLEFDRRLIARVHALTAELSPEHPGVKVDLTGAYVILVEENAVMSADLVRAGALATVIALAILLFASRRPSALVIVGAPVALGIAATFAFAKAIVGHLNPVTSFLGAILIGLGVEYGVHLSMRYWEEREQYDAREAMHRAMLGTFSGALTSAATNAAAFFVLVFAELEAFQQFGKIAAFGVMSTLLAAYLMGPSVLFVSEKIRPYRRAGAPSAPAAQKVERRPLPGGLLALVIGATLGFVVYSVAVYPKVGFATDLKAMKGESPATALDEHITRQLGIVWRPSILYLRSIDDARAAAAIAADVRAQGGDHTAIDRVVSIDDLLPHDVEAHLALMADLRRELKSVSRAKDDRVKEVLELTEAAPWGPAELPAEVKRRFMPFEGEGTFVLIFPRFSGYDTTELKLQAADLDEIMKRLRARGIEAHLLDGNRIAARVLGMIRSDGPRVLALASVVVFAMIWLSLRSLKRAVLVAVPLYAGLCCLCGAMHLFGVQLNFLNVVVLPNLLTIAVDNSVHLYHRYEEEGRGSLPHVLGHTGFAAAVATASNAAGYGAMLVARHAGLRSVGTLAVLGVVCTFVGTTLLFPALLALLERSEALQSSRRADPRAG